MAEHGRGGAGFGRGDLLADRAGGRRIAIKCLPLVLDLTDGPNGQSKTLPEGWLVTTRMSWCIFTVASAGKRINTCSVDAERRRAGRLHN